MPVVWDGIIQIPVEQANIKEQFAARVRFCNVFRAIDCTHIAVKAPSKDYFVHVNRKHFNLVKVNSGIQTS